jgi:hypothetical protein
MPSTINASTASGGGIISSADSSGVLELQTAGTTALTIATSGNVGIGTSSPTGKLQVNGIIQSGATGTNGNFQLLRSSDGAAAGSVSWDSTNTAIAINNGVGTGVITLLTNSTERMRISAAGVVTVGGSAVLTEGTGVDSTQNANTTMSAETWYKIGDVPQSSILCACYVYMDAGYDGSNNNLYWMSGWGFVIGCIGTNIYNSSPEEAITVNGAYHHRVVASPVFKFDSDQSAGGYGNNSIFIKFPQTTRVQNLRFNYKRLM